MSDEIKNLIDLVIKETVDVLIAAPSFLFIDNWKITYSIIGIFGLSICFKKFGKLFK